MFGEDFKDLANVGAAPLTDEDKAAGLGWGVICEGCGCIIVDDDGVCIDPTCKVHGAKHE